MTPAQQAAIEEAAKEICKNVSTWTEIWSAMGEEICTNPEKYGLVSMKRHKEQVKANLYYRKLYQIAISQPMIPLSEALEFAEWTTKKGWHFHIRKNNWMNLNIGDNQFQELTTSQLWEEFQEYKKQKS